MKSILWTPLQSLERGGNSIVMAPPFHDVGLATGLECGHMVNEDITLIYWEACAAALLFGPLGYAQPRTSSTYDNPVITYMWTRKVHMDDKSSDVGT